MACRTPSRTARARRVRLVTALIRAGWNPPRPDERIAEAIADDIALVSGGYGGIASVELAPRELRALRLAAEGMTVAEAAAAAGVSENTMKTQLQEALERLGARNKPHAVAICFREGLLS